MWKDYFYFTSKERRAIWTFSILILVIQALTWSSDLWLPYLKENKTSESTFKESTKNEIAPIKYKDFSNTSHSTKVLSSNKTLLSKTPDKIKRTKPKQNLSNYKHSKVFKKQKYITGTVEINQADTAILNRIKWIGNSTATRIIKFRKLLGGYYSKSQIKEIYGLHEEQIKSLEQHISIDKTKIKKINIYYASIERLKRHPYINFYQARAIVENRRKCTLDSILNMKEFTKKDKDRISNYLIAQDSLSLK